jgi:2-isopropylmalate synthase
MRWHGDREGVAVHEERERGHFVDYNTQAVTHTYDWNRANGPIQLFKPGVTTFQDETLRDGIQSPSATDPSIEDKIELIHIMDRLGIHYVNVGLPAASARNRQDCLEACQEIVRCKLKIRPVAAARTMRDDIGPIAELAQKTGIPVVAYAFIGTSEIRKLAESWDIALLVKRSVEAVDFAVREGVEIAYVTEDTTRANPATLRELWKSAIEHGASRLCLADTVGHVTPDGLRNLLDFTRKLIAETGVEKVGIDWHGHNDRGIALPNALWALELGIDRIHGTAMGIGERTGNTPLEMLLFNLWAWGQIELDPQDLQRFCEVTARAVKWPGGAPKRLFKLTELSSSPLFS